MQVSFFPIILSLHTKADRYKTKITSCRLCLLHIHQGGGVWLGRRKRQQRLGTMLKTLPPPALKASHPWSQSHVGLNGDGSDADVKEPEHQRKDQRLLTRVHGHSVTIPGQLHRDNYKSDVNATQKPQKHPSTGPSKGPGARMSFQRGWGPRTQTWMGCINTKTYYWSESNMCEFNI